MTKLQTVKQIVANYAPDVKPFKRYDYRYAACNGRHVVNFHVDGDLFSIELVKRRRVVIDYTNHRAWTF